MAELSLKIDDVLGTSRRAYFEGGGQFVPTHVDRKRVIFTPSQNSYYSTSELNLRHGTLRVSRVFSEVGATLQGANFWGWSGFAQPAHTQWEKGDDYSGDPAQEAQGLNGVYVTDTTVDVIKQAIDNLNQ